MSIFILLKKLRGKFKTDHFANLLINNKLTSHKYDKNYEYIAYLPSFVIFELFFNLN